MSYSEFPPSTSESLKSIRDATYGIRWELRNRPALDDSALEDALHYADGFLWQVLDILIAKAKTGNFDGP
jgi:hypothetical protein